MIIFYPTFDEDKIMYPCSFFSRPYLWGQSGHSNGSAVTTPRPALAASQMRPYPWWERRGGGKLRRCMVAFSLPILLPRIRKQAPYPCFQKLHPHGGGHIRGPSGVVTMVIQVHRSWEPLLSRILLQHGSWEPLLYRTRLHHFSEQMASFEMRH